MKPPETLAEGRSNRLMRAIAELKPFPNRLDGSRRSAGVILEQMRERAGLEPKDVGPLYTAAYKRLFPDHGDSSVSTNTIGNWEKGEREPLHGLRAFIALFAVYIVAAPPARAISHEHVENALFQYGFRRLHLEEINALFPDGTPSPTAATSDVAEIRSMRRHADGRSVELHYDEISDEQRVVRTIGRIVADSDGPVLHEETIDELESETRRVVRSGADPAAFIEIVSGLVRALKEPNDKEVMRLVRMFTDRLSEDHEGPSPTESRHQHETRTSAP